jgi:hypothetical protein
VARLTAAGAVGDRTRRASAQDLVARFRALRERISQANPQIDRLTWDEILAMRDP